MDGLMRVNRDSFLGRNTRRKTDGASGPGETTTSGRGIDEEVDGKMVAELKGLCFAQDRTWLDGDDGLVWIRFVVPKMAKRIKTIEALLFGKQACV